MEGSLDMILAMVPRSTSSLERTPASSVAAGGMGGRKSMTFSIFFQRSLIMESTSYNLAGAERSF